MPNGDREQDLHEQAAGLVAAIKATGCEPEWLEILGDELPALKAATSLRDMYLQRKMRRLFEGVAKGKAAQRAAALLKLSTDDGFRRQFGAHLFHTVDSFDRLEKVDMLVNAFLGLAYDEVAVTDYQRMARAVRQLLVDDIRLFLLRGEHRTVSDEASEELCVLGLAARRWEQKADPMATLRLGRSEFSTVREATHRVVQQFRPTSLGRLFIRCQERGPVRLLPASGTGDQD